MTLKKLLFTATITATAFASMHANAADETGNASAEIIQAITVTENTPMDFSQIIPDAGGDTVSLAVDGSRSATGSSTFLGSGQQGIFDITGAASQAVTVSFSSGDVLSGPGTDMALNNFVHDAGGSPALDGTGNLQLAVGADLGVNASQTAGAYSGTYTISVNY